MDPGRADGGGGGDFPWNDQEKPAKMVTLEQGLEGGSRKEPHVDRAAGTAFWVDGTTDAGPRGRVCLACVRISEGAVIGMTARCLVPAAITSRQDPCCHH